MPRELVNVCDEVGGQSTFRRRPLLARLRNAAGNLTRLDSAVKTVAAIAHNSLQSVVIGPSASIQAPNLSARLTATCLREKRLSYCSLLTRLPVNPEGGTCQRNCRCEPRPGAMVSPWVEGSCVCGGLSSPSTRLRVRVALCFQAFAGGEASEPNLFGFRPSYIEVKSYTSFPRRPSADLWYRFELHLQPLRVKSHCPCSSHVESSK